MHRFQLNPFHHVQIIVVHLTKENNGCTTHQRHHWLQLHEIRSQLAKMEPYAYLMLLQAKFNHE